MAKGSGGAGRDSNFGRGGPLYTRSSAVPAGYKDVTGKLTSGVFGNKEDLPPTGTRFTFKEPSQKGYGVEFWEVTKPVRLGNKGWTVGVKRVRGYSWQRGDTSRLDKLADKFVRSKWGAQTLIFAKRGG